MPNYILTYHSLDAALAALRRLNGKRDGFLYYICDYETGSTITLKNARKLEKLTPKEIQLFGIYRKEAEKNE